MSTQNICFHGKIRKYYVDTTSYLGLYKPSSIMLSNVMAFFCKALLITEVSHDIHDLCDLVQVTHFHVAAKKLLNC